MGCYVRDSFGLAQCTYVQDGSLETLSLATRRSRFFPFDLVAAPSLPLPPPASSSPLLSLEDSTSFLRA
ncbi:hypothetical protein K1719_002125 [Acacia pycnantha]|nr:hypothetical protein K1719_002125 [Acacia pycnantha]